MLLNRLTPASQFKIQFPIWNERAIGLAAHNVGEHNEIEILATSTKDGRRYYEGKYYISGEMVRQCEREMRKGVLLFKVPIEMLEPLERTS